MKLVAWCEERGNKQNRSLPWITVFLHCVYLSYFDTLCQLSLSFFPLPFSSFHFHTILDATLLCLWSFLSLAFKTLTKNRLMWGHAPYKSYDLLWFFCFTAVLQQQLSINLCVFVSQIARVAAYFFVSCSENTVENISILNTRTTRKSNEISTFFDSV